MKQFIHPRLGAAPVLAFFAFAAICVGSCGDSNSNGTPLKAELASSVHPILIAGDSSLGGGSGTGGRPMVTIGCLGLDCPVMKLGSYVPTAVGNDSVAYVIEATTTGAIPANTTLRMEIRMKKDATMPIDSGAMKK